MTEPLIRTNEIVRTLPDFRLGPISIELEPGLVYALVGPNGSGKSTLFRMLMGQIRPEQGTIERFGESLRVDDQSQARRIAYVPDALTGFENWPMSDVNELYRRTYPNFDPRLARRLQNKVNLRKPFTQLSKGMQRRAMLGVALATQPDVLLLDEPMDGIDPFARQDWLTDFAEFMETDDRTLLLATHSLDDVRRIADVVIVLEQGKHIGTWSKDELLEDWQRIWISMLPKQSVTGEQSRGLSEAGSYIVTNDARATRAELEALGIEIVSMQPVDMVDVIRAAMMRSRGGLPL